MVSSGADTAVDGTERAVLGTLAQLGNASRTALRHAHKVECLILRNSLVLIQNVPPVLRSAAEMPLGAIGATYQTVNCALRMQVMAAAEYDRDGTIQGGGGGGAVDVESGRVRSRGAPAGDKGQVQRAQRKGRRQKQSHEHRVMWRQVRNGWWSIRPAP